MSDQLLFIHSSVDDFGLPLAPFRIVCHVARRAGPDGICWASIQSIAKTCRLRRNTACAAVYFLERQQIISVTREPGRTNQIQLRPFKDWRPVPKEHPPQNRTQPKRDTTPHPKGILHPPQSGYTTQPKRDTQRISPEVTPKKDIQVRKKASSKLLDSSSQKLSEQDELRALINRKEGSR